MQEQKSDALKILETRDWLKGLIRKSLGRVEEFLKNLPKTTFEVVNINDADRIIDGIKEAQGKIDEASRRASLMDGLCKNLGGPGEGYADMLTQIDRFSRELSVAEQAVRARKRTLLYRQEIRQLKAGQLHDARELIEDLERISMKDRISHGDVQVIRREFERNHARGRQDLMERYWDALDTIAIKVGYEITM